MVGEEARSILRLPGEILVDIFLLAQDPWEFEPWYRLLWVCRRWSSVGRGAPILWREIKIRKRPNVAFVRASLRYSDTIPIDVTFSETVDMAGSLALLAPHVGRFRRLHIAGIKNTKDKAVHKLMSQTMPLLEELNLHFARSKPPRLDLDLFTPAYEEDTELFFWAPHLKQFPKLQSLTLGRAVSIQGPIPVFLTLRKLELHDFLPALFTLPELAHFLLKHPHLEEFSMRKYRPTLVTVPAPLALPGKLRKISLEDNAHYVKPFLSSFYIPPDVDVTLIRALDYMDHGDLGPSFSQITLDVKTHFSATRMLPDNRYLMPILSLVNKVTIRREFESLHSIIGTTPSGNVVELSGRAYDDAEDDLRDGLRLLRDVVTMFSGAPIEEICIEGHGSSRIEEEDWSLALHTFPTLERLSILGTGGGEWDARYSLMDALQSIPEPARKMSTSQKKKPKKKAGSGPPAPALWPHLKSLTIVSDELDGEDDEFAQALATCLQNRADRGSRLHELRLVLKYFKYRRPDFGDNGDEGDDRGEEDNVYDHDVQSGGDSEDDDSNDEENTKRRNLYAEKLQPVVEHLHFEFVNGYRQW